MSVLHERQLATLSQARQWIIEAKNIEDVLEFRDQAEAIRHYRQVSGEAVEACNEAAEMKLRAERRIGVLIAEMQDNGEIHKGGRPSGNLSLATTGLRLSEVEVTRDQSAQWQKLASLPAEAFEAHIREVRESGEQLTTAGALRLAKSVVKQEKRNDIRERAAGAECLVSLDGLIADERKFGTVYADPPWVYDNQRTRGATSDHYVGLSVDEIAAMPIAKLVADDAHLHLWTTNAFLFDCPRIMAAWGFEFRSMFIWAKPQIGMGNYWRVSHEFLLLGVRGSCPFADHSLRSWMEEDRGQHSAKPERVRHLVERASPGPYLELFGRRAVDGWAVFGNEVERDLFTRTEEAP